MTELNPENTPDKPKPNGSTEVLKFNKRQADDAILNDFEALERATTLDGDEGDEPGSQDEPTSIEVVSKMPKFARFRSNPETKFEMWATVDEAGMDRTIIAATKEFAPVLEEVCELHKVLFYETVTPDSVIRLVYVTKPEKGVKKQNSWNSSKHEALELSLTNWITMRSVKRLAKYVFGRARKDYGEPVFSGMSKGELIHYALRKPGLLADNESHPFYLKAADRDDE